MANNKCVRNSACAAKIIHSDSAPFSEFFCDTAGVDGLCDLPNSRLHIFICLLSLTKELGAETNYIRVLFLQMAFHLGRN